jgi:hypothetical protein
MGLVVRHIKIGPAQLEVVELYFKNRANAEKGEINTVADTLTLKDDFGNSGTFKRCLIAADMIIDFDEKLKADEENAVSQIRAQIRLEERKKGIASLAKPIRMPAA